MVSQEVVESRFHVDLKSNLALKLFHGVFALSDYYTTVLYESRMKWTWHNSKLAVEEVSFFGGLRVVLLQLLSIHDRAVGVTNLGVMLLCTGRPAQGCDYCITTGNSAPDTPTVMSVERIAMSTGQSPQLWGVFCEDFGENWPCYRNQLTAHNQLNNKQINIALA